MPTKPAAPPRDLVPLPDLAPAQREAEELEASIDLIPLETAEDAAWIVDFIKGVKAKAAELDGQRKAIVDPLNLATKRVNALFAPILTKLRTAEGALRLRLVRHEQEARARAQAALEAASAAAVAGDTGAVQGAIETHDVAISSAKAPGVSYRRSWSYEVTEPDAVPRELCSPDPAKLRAFAALHKEKAEAEGVRFFEVTTTAVR